MAPVQDWINRIYREQGGKNNYFDAALGSAIEAARTGVADIDRAYTRGAEAVDTQYDEMQRDLLRSRDDTYKQNTGQFAGQGILKSGIFATEQGKVAEAYQRGLTDAAKRRTEGRQSLIDQRLSGYNALVGNLRNARSGAISRAVTRRQEAAQRKIEAEFRKRQAFMAQVAQNNARAILQQQLALARRPVGGGGGGGGGGGYYDLASLFPGMFGPQPSKGAQKAAAMGSNAGGGGAYARRTGRTR